MKKIILALMLVLPIVLMAEKGNFTLSDKVGDFNAPANAYLVCHLEKENVLDSSAIQNGKFEFKGSINEPKYALLGIIREGTGLRNGVKEILPIYLELATIKVIRPDSLIKAKITGSKINFDIEKRHLALKQIQLKEDTIQAEYEAMSYEKRYDEANMCEITKKMSLITNERIQITFDFIKSNPDSYLSLNLLRTYGGNPPDYTKISLLFNGLSDEVKHSEDGKAYAAYLEKTNSKEYADSVQKANGITIGEMAPQFTQNDPIGKPIKLSDFKGKYILVDFWASWCSPCRGENPNVVRAYAIYHDKGLEILGVSLDTDKEAWIKAINFDKLIWKHVSDLKGFKNEVSVLYRIHAVPANLLIDPAGKVIATNLRGEALKKKLSEIFK